MLGTKEHTVSASDALTEDTINLLPSLLRDGASSFRTLHEKTIFVYSALTACGGLLTRGSGLYYQRQVYPNLFFILTAPAASGKSCLTSAYDLLYPVHLEYLNKSLQLQEQYKRALADKSAKKDGLKRPPFHSVLIPGNISASRLMQHLSDNAPDVPSVLVESELDTLTQANKSDFGGFSDILRRAFHNERISLSRKGNDEFIEVKQPKLSMILSGTPKQLYRLIPSAEDGLYSRCMLYSFSPEIKWVDVSPGADLTDVAKVMEKLSKDVYSFWRFFKGRTVEFQLSDTQWEKLNAHFEKRLEELASISGSASISVVKRHGVICFKLAMILTALRAFEFGSIETVYECYDRDFAAALALAELSLNRSLYMLEQLPDGEPLTSRKQKREAYKKALPSTFTSEQARALAKAMDVGERTLYRWLELWMQDGVLSREDHGQYKRLK